MPLIENFKDEDIKALNDNLLGSLSTLSSISSQLANMVGNVAFNAITTDLYGGDDGDTMETILIELAAWQAGAGSTKKFLCQQWFNNEEGYLSLSVTYTSL